jgi:tetratricopeptide (TPR) repeat protein
MSAQNSKSHISKSTTNAATNITSRSSTTERRCELVQNYLLIWVDDNIDLENEDCENTLTKLRGVVRKVDHCTTPAECIEFLNKMDDEKAFVIVSGALGQRLVPDIHDMAQVRAIYIFCSNKARRSWWKTSKRKTPKRKTSKGKIWNSDTSLCLSCSTFSFPYFPFRRFPCRRFPPTPARHEGWANEWSKIQGVFTAIKPICESLKKVARECDHDTISMSFVPKRKTSATTTSDQEDLDQLPPSFMYSTLFKEIMLEIRENVNESIGNLVVYCRKKDIPQQELMEFQATYHQESPIWWYSCESFLYPMLNRALRSLDMETMTKMGFFIRSLHLQLQELHKKQSSTYNKQFVVYRGQGLSQEDFQHLNDTKGGLMSFNCFLSTSTEREVSMRFLDQSVKKCKENIGVLFIMTIDPRKLSASTSTPFAFIDDYSAMLTKEKEILFSMHTVFRVDDIKQMPTNSHLWEVQLTLTDDNDPQLAGLMKYMKEELSGSTGWYRLGELMLKVSDFNQAEELYNQLLSKASSDNDTAYIYNQLGWLKRDQGAYKEAAAFYEQSLEIYRRILPEGDLSLSATYNNIAIVYNYMGEYSKALEFYEKSHKIYEKALPPNHPHLAISYGNIGLVYNDMGEYSKALEFYEKSHKIYEKALPPNHPSLAISYGNIGRVYQDMGEYSKALEFYEKSHQIKEKALPPNHPSLATSYNNVGKVYRNMKEYSKALDYFQKCLGIRQKTLPTKHPNLAITYSNIGDVHRLMGDYEKALTFHQKALDIQENVQCDPLQCATTYVNLGETYREMKDYTVALTYYQKGMEIREEKLSKTHCDLAVVYHNLAKLYLATREYNTAMKNVQQALKIAEEKLPQNHPHLKDYRDTLEKIRKKL